MDRKGDTSSPIAHVSSTTPPMFLQAGDDPVDCRNSVEMFLALKNAKVPAELHIYSSGGHGFGLRPRPTPVAPGRTAAKSGCAIGNSHAGAIEVSGRVFCSPTGLPVQEREREGRIEVPPHLDPPAKTMAGAGPRRAETFTLSAPC